jgi:hypothetical protein
LASLSAALLIMASVALLAAGCATGTAPSAPSVTSVTSAHRAASGGHPTVLRTPEVSVRLIVPSPHIVSGSSVKARLVIDNRTGHAIPVADCAREAYQVLLENRKYRPGPSWTQCLTLDSIPPGVSVREVPLQAFANACAYAAVPPGLMACGPGGKEPTLPPGTYTAHVFAVSPALPAAPDVTVHVLPSR